MIDDMGIFRTSITITGLSQAGRKRALDDVMVDTGSEYSWIPRDILEELQVAPLRIDAFQTADGRVVRREVGFALISAGGRIAASAVVFAEPGDMALLGAHTLEGLNLRVDSTTKRLVDAGPAPAAVAAA